MPNWSSTAIINHSQQPQRRRRRISIITTFDGQIEHRLERFGREDVVESSGDVLEFVVQEGSDQTGQDLCHRGKGPSGRGHDPPHGQSKVFEGDVNFLDVYGQLLLAEEYLRVSSLEGDQRRLRAETLEVGTAVACGSRGQDPMNGQE